MATYKKALFTMGVVLLFISVSFSLYFAYKGVQHGAALSERPQEEMATYHLALIPQEIDNDYWRLVQKGAREAERKHEVTLEYTGPNQTDIEEHIQYIEMAIASKVDGILTQGLNEAEFTPVINEAIEKGIPVITVDTDAPDSERITYIGTDNYHAGYLAGQALIEDTNGEAVVGIITGSLDASHMQLRVEGFTDAVENEPGIDIVAVEPSNITRIQAEERASKIIEEHPDITAFFGTSALDGIGIVEAVERAGLMDDMYMIGFDTLPETIELIKEGKIDATVVQEPYEIGFLAVEKMVDVMNGGDVDRYYYTDTRVIGREDVLSAPASTFDHSSSP
jgi:ribose transport system substrate-binding protein